MKITEILDITWNYQMTEQLLALLFDEQKRITAFERYLATKPDLSQDCFLEEFQASFAERKKLKQDYTPSSVCQISAMLSANDKSVLDICAGTGALTIAKWGKCPNAMFYCEEFSKEAVAILLFNLAVRGMNAEVRHCDVLTGEVFAGYRLTRCGKYSSIEQIELDWSMLKVDCVISNPPYSANWTPKQDERFEGFALAPKSKADYAFLLHGLHYLNENGSASFILPHGVLFRGASEEKIRKELIDRNLLDCVIGLPNKLFLATDIPVAILHFKKQRKNNDIYFIDAGNLFIKQKPNNAMLDEHIQQVISAYQLRKNIDKLAFVASLDFIYKNECNLNIPRYVNKSEPEPIPDFLKEAQELLAITQELDQANQTFLKMLEEIEVYSGSAQEKAEFEQAKQCLKQAFAPRQYKTAVLNKISKLNEANYQATFFDNEEMEELNGFIENKEKQIEILKNIRKYFLGKMFV